MPIRPQSTEEPRPAEQSESEGAPGSGDDARYRALEDLFRDYFGSVYAYFLRQGFTVEEAKDLAQETFFRAWRGIGEFREDAGLTTWLFRIARNVLLNVWRDRKSLKRNGTTVSLDGDPEDDEAVVLESEAEPSPEEALLEEEKSRLLERELERLPAQMRQCLLLRLGDLKYREIADILGVSIETVKSHLHQARRRLRAELGQHFEIDLGAGWEGGGTDHG